MLTSDLANWINHTIPELGNLPPTQVMIFIILATWAGYAAGWIDGRKPFKKENKNK